MNDLHHPCEDWAERISLAAAGCLSPDEEQDVRRHIETCSDCRERFRQFTDLCGGLAEARLPADGAEAAIVERIMSAVASDESGRPSVRTRAEMIQPALLTRSLSKWRW
ncbi:MAG: zf-HC2 domain-containing protein, partial [Planctomycetota bacterium]